MIDNRLIQSLVAVVGQSRVSVTRTGMELYSYDASLVKGHPSVVVFPADSSQVAQVVKMAVQAGVDIVPRGFGTNLSGGTISVTRGLVIAMTRFNNILEICPENRYAVVQPGVTNLEVQQALAKFGAFYAPDPASQKVATLGGNAGENSGGPLCLKYGVTTNHILGMELVTADGEILRIGGPALDPPGLDLRGILVGSEGTLGIVTELTLRTLPRCESVITMLAVYDEIQAAARSVSGISSAGIVPSTLEMMDATVIEAVEASAPCGYPTDAAAVLIIEVEGVRAGLEEQAARIRQICMDTGCRNIQTAGNAAERDRLWQGRRGAFGAIARLAPNYLVNDACVPRTRLPEALEQVGAIAEHYGCRVGNVFHAGDGNLHPLLLFDSRNPRELDMVHRAGWDIMAACVSLGGTISGEHGIGKEKQAAMHMIFSHDDLAAQRLVKQAFDPHQRINPDKIIPLPYPQGGPFLLNRPGGMSASGVSAAADAIQAAAEAGRSVLITGTGCFANACHLSSTDTTPVSTLGMTDIIEYDPANQFITAGAGMSLSSLQQVLGKNNQWLPLRPPWRGEIITTGAVAATGVSGPERMRYGAPRDLALGLRYLDSRGRIIAAGGKVVKNVAGYDMTRLMIGSYGGLGMITEITWKVVTRADTCLAVQARGSLTHCVQAALTLMNAPLFPALIVAAPATDHPPAGSSPFILTVGFEGHAAAVRHKAAVCGNLVKDAGLDSATLDTYDIVAGCLRKSFADLDRYPFILKASGSLDFLLHNVQVIDDLAHPDHWLLDCGNGRVFAALNQLPDDMWRSLTCGADFWSSDAATMKNARTKGAGNHIILEKFPNAFCRTHDLFSPIPGPVQDLTRRIKQALDPGRLFVSGQLT
ncbi:MAG: FAD-binding protein [Desulfotignum sp.]|nr:FAD-binding protein [Desulfotignum sp.]